MLAIIGVLTVTVIVTLIVVLTVDLTVDLTDVVIVLIC